MAYSETDRGWIRRYLGTGAIFLQAWPLIESAITATSSIADGGSRPDSSEENQVKGLIYGFVAVTGSAAGITPGPTAQNVVFNTPAVRGLIQIESSIAFQDNLLGTMEAVGEARLDPYREIVRLRAEGKRLAFMLARKLGMKRPIANVFSGSSRDEVEPVTMEDLFPASRNW